MFYLFSGANTVAVIMLALSGSARSNGALNAGYFCFQALLQAYDAAVQKKRPLVCSTSVLIMNNSICTKRPKDNHIALNYLLFHKKQSAKTCLFNNFSLFWPVGDAGPCDWSFALHFHICTFLCFPSIWIFEHMSTWELRGIEAVVQSKSSLVVWIHSEPLLVIFSM